MVQRPDFSLCMPTSKIYAESYDMSKSKVCFLNLLTLEVGVWESCVYRLLYGKYMVLETHIIEI